MKNVTRHIRLINNKNNPYYCLYINNNQIKFKQNYDTLDEAVAARDNILYNLELKKLEQLKVDLTIKEFPYNLIDALELETTDVIASFEERLNEVLLNHVTPREQFIIMQIYAQHRTYETIATDMQITKERVRQIHAKALRKLSHHKKYLLTGIYSEPEYMAKKKFEEYILSMRDAWTYESALDYIKNHKKSYCPIIEDSIDDLELSIRSSNCLKRANITSVQQLTEKTVKDMMKVKNLGRKSLKEIRTKLQSLGLDFKEYEEIEDQEILIGDTKWIE